MCTSHCGVIATVEDGKLVGVNADPGHPNGCICVKGTAAPEIVYSPDRVLHPLVRTRPKGDPNPGWVQVTWGQALNLAALRLTHIKDNFGAEAVVFSRATTAGSAAIDFDGWVQRLANAFGSPNLLTSNHICTWNRRVGSKYTYGSPMPLADFDNSQCMLIWGINPPATSPAQASRISRARNRGARLIVIDPRKTSLAAKADCWLRVRPGKDGELAMAMIHVMIEEHLYDAEFVRNWTNAPFLVRDDNRQLLMAGDVQADGDQKTWMVWDQRDGLTAHQNAKASVIAGNFAIRLLDGTEVTCRPAFEILRQAAEPFAPEQSQEITTAGAAEVRRAVRLFAQAKPSSYCTWVGLEQDNDALQTNRAVCIFYALTGQYDQRGSNVLFAVTPTNPINGRELLPKSQAKQRLGLDQHPLGPPADPGIVQAAQVYDAILAEKPYPVKALVLFGSDPLLGHGDPLRGKAALEALDFYIHVDTIINPSAMFADLILPAATCWEREALMPSFDIAEDTVNWVQLRRTTVKPVGEARSEVEIILDLATRLEFAKHFFGGDAQTALAHQLAPSGMTVEELRANPRGQRANVKTRYQKYRETDVATGHAKGFGTPTRKIEIYSTALAAAGHSPLPDFKTKNNPDPGYPLTLTFFRDIHFCDEQHRNIARLRKALPEPVIEIHPDTAKARAIGDGDWTRVETRSGGVTLKAKLNASLDPMVVATIYGWWQPCADLQAMGYDPFHQDGANSNLLIPNTDQDPLSASVAHRAQQVRIRKVDGER